MEESREGQLRTGCLEIWVPGAWNVDRLPKSIHVPHRELWEARETCEDSPRRPCGTCGRAMPRLFRQCRTGGAQRSTRTGLDDISAPGRLNL